MAASAENGRTGLQSPQPPPPQKRPSQLPRLTAILLVPQALAARHLVALEARPRLDHQEVLLPKDHQAAPLPAVPQVALLPAAHQAALLPEVLLVVLPQVAHQVALLPAVLPAVLLPVAHQAALLLAVVLVALPRLVVLAALLPAVPAALLRHRPVSLDLKRPASLTNLSIFW